MIDTVVRRVIKTLPETKVILNKNQLKYASIPHLEQPKIMLNLKIQKKIHLMKCLINGNYEQAIKLIKANLKVNPNNDEIIFLKGRSQLMLNQYEKAASTFLDALAIKMDRTINGLGYAYTKLKQPKKAIAAYNKAITLNNKNSFAYFNSGLL